jgi:uncharacterized RDD family membrane protein YckC
VRCGEWISALGDGLLYLGPIVDFIAGGYTVQDMGSTALPATAYAGFWRRFAALFIDGIVLAIIGAILNGVLGQGSGLAQALGIVVSFGYFIYFFTSTGQSLGAKVMGIKVVSVNGGLLTMGSAIIRIIGTYVSGAILGIGYLWMLWDGRKQTLHDKMANSLVVMA